MWKSVADAGLDIREGGACRDVPEQSALPPRGHLWDAGRPGAAARYRRQAGFTLMEVLVALALLSLMAGVLLQVMTVGLRAQKSSQMSVQALEVAGRVLQEFTRDGGSRLTQGRRVGQEGGFTYQITVDPQFAVPPITPGSPRVTCFLVRVTVSWQERGRTRSVALATMRTVAQKAA